MPISRTIYTVYFSYLHKNTIGPVLYQILQSHASIKLRYNNNSYIKDENIHGNITSIHFVVHHTVPPTYQLTLKIVKLALEAKKMNFNLDIKIRSDAQIHKY